MGVLQRERLLKFGAVPFTTDVIAGELGDYSAVLAKIAALVDEGSLVAAGGDFRRSCFALEFPGMRKYNRLCDYPNKDALLAAEPDEVKKVVDFSQNGTNYPAVVLSWIGFCRLVPQYSSIMKKVSA